MIDIDKISKKIAKSVIALNYDDINSLHNQNGSPKPTNNIVNQFKKISKAIHSISQKNNDRKWWKIWEKYDDPDEIQDTIISYIAHQHFLNMQEQLHNSMELNEQAENMEIELDGVDMTTLSKEQQIDSMKKINTLRKLSRDCIDDRNQAYNSVQEMMDRINNLLTFGSSRASTRAPSGLCQDKDSELYKGVCANQKVREAFQSLVNQLRKVQRSMSGKYAPVNLNSPRVYVATFGDGTIIKRKAIELSNAIKNNQHAEEKGNSSGGDTSSGNNSSGGTSSGGSNSSGGDASSGEISIEEMIKRLKGRFLDISDRYTNLKEYAQQIIEDMKRKYKEKLTVQCVKAWENLNIDNSPIRKENINSDTINRIISIIDRSIDNQKNMIEEDIEKLAELEGNKYEDMIEKKNEYINSIISSIYNDSFSNNPGLDKINVSNLEDSIKSIFAGLPKSISGGLFFKRLVEDFERYIKDKYNEIKDRYIDLSRTIRIARRITDSYFK